MSESIQNKLKRVRAPRVKITYDVETEGAERLIELPFIIGVISDLSADNNENSSIRNKEFVEVDRDNLNKFMSNIIPKLSYSVKNTLTEDLIGQKTDSLNINLVFQSMDDFDIKNIVLQIPELRGIYNKIQLLKDMMVKLDGNYKLADALLAIIKNKNDLNSIKKDLKTFIDSNKIKE